MICELAKIDLSFNESSNLPGFEIHGTRKVNTSQKKISNKTCRIFTCLYKNPFLKLRVNKININ